VRASVQIIFLISRRSGSSGFLREEKPKESHSAKNVLFAIDPGPTEAVQFS